ncbi:MAG: TIR domain-containing protein [Betaproteobacteria bacterium]|nr:TIR domain-containing protein [Betaproteobacteria bacterium]
MAGIFVSYRRSDSAGFAGRLVDDLERQFPGHQLFRDIESIEAGADFVDAIERALRASSVLLVVIGPRWLDVRDADDRRRLDDPRDFVRLEIAAALKLGLRVIPVLVDGAQVPPAGELPPDIQALARRQGHELSDRRWDYDVDQLFSQLARVRGLRRKKANADGNEPGRRKSRWLPRLGLGAAAGVIALALAGVFSEDPPSVAPGVPVRSVLPESPATAAPAAEAATTPAARTVARAQTVASASERVRESEPPRTSPVVHTNLTGLWRTPEGDSLYFRHEHDQLAVVAGDATATQGFVGSGRLQGRQVTLALTHLQSGVPVTMDLRVSPDGTRMSGVGRVAGMTDGERIVLVRQ